MSDSGVPGEQKSIEELKEDLAEVSREIDEVEAEVAAEHPKRPTFAEGEDAVDD